MQRRRVTLDSCQKIRQQKLIQWLLVLDKCVQIPHDDRLLIRKHLKQAEAALLDIMENYKKDRSMAELQVRLRKYVNSTKSKGKNDYARRVYSQQSQGNSYQGSHHATPEKDEKPTVHLDMGQLRKKLQENRGSRGNGPIIRDISLTKPSRQGVASPRVDLSKPKSKPPKSVDKTDFVNWSGSKPTCEEGTTPRAFTQRNQFRPKTSNSSMIANKENLKTVRKKEERRESSYILEDISNNLSYSSSVKNMLVSKLKDKSTNPHPPTVTPSNESRILADARKVEKTKMTQVPLIQSIDLTTTNRKPVRPLKKDEPSVEEPFNALSDIQPISIYLEDSWVDKRSSVGSSRQTFDRVQRPAETPIAVIDEDDGKMGRFYERIRRIIEDEED